MARKENFLKNLCNLTYGIGNHCKLTEQELLASGYYEAVVNVYRILGGVLSMPPIRVGKYDIDTANFIIELDEENHFNRYRLSTLNSPIYANNPNIDVAQYKKFCKNYEDRCLTYGKYAKNDSTEKQFGYCELDGNLGDSRSRWKQRAFYDFIKDITSIVKNVPIIRISIYEKYKGLTIEKLIDGEYRGLLIEYINMRLDGLK